MRKRITLILFLVVLFVGYSICNANVLILPKNQFAISGVNIGCSASVVETRLGKPEIISTQGDSKLYTYNNKGVYVYFKNKKVNMITVTRPGMMTPAGVEVGMDVTSLTNIYGSPYASGTKDSTFDRTLVYMGDIGLFSFGIRNNKIARINCMGN